MNKYTTEKGLERYIGAVLNSLPKHLDVGLVIQTKFFHQQRAHLVIYAKFQVILSEYPNFQKSGT